MRLQALRGTTDLLPDDVQRWAAVEQTAKRVSALYGYREIRTPVIEDAALFLRSIGETTDIIQKEMFRFEDRGGHDIVLRPEGTASVVRAYLEHNLHKTEGFSKLLYLGPMFRAERPQAGRFRQFHQFGVEAIGSASPWVDVEAITLCAHILRECGVIEITVLLSSMGCRKDQAATAQLLRESLDRTLLCKECQGRFDRNIFRVVDCKNPKCNTLLNLTIAKLDAPRDAVASRELRPRYRPALFQLCDECLGHFDEVCRGLEAAGIRFDHKKVFARGLDYYTRTVFEVRATGLGAQDAVAAGGRYDHLVEELGGPSLGAFGFAAGIERLLMAARSQSGAVETAPPRHGFYLATVQPALAGEAFRLVQQLRGRGVSALMDYEGKSLKAQLREADKLGCRFMAVLGDAELKQRSINVKELEQGTQESVSLDALVETVAQRTR